LSRSAREVPKEIAAFGERQFRETGALAVEVLRVKASVMRKHFKQLKSITFLVSVIARDRVRIYFFNSAGIMLVGENVELPKYQKIRTSSKLIAKYEKPRELTPEELRIEATQDFRDSLAKAIRRVARFLKVAAPTFPNIFVTRRRLDESTQNFGLQITDDGEYLFEESALKTGWIDGLIIRTAFLTHLGPERSKSQIAALVGNGVAIALLKNPERNAFRETWLKLSIDTGWFSLANHLIKHADTFADYGFLRLLMLLQQIPSSMPESYDWKSAFRVIHDSITVPIGTEEYHLIQRFCLHLTKPRKLESQKDVLQSIHLAPRVVCDPTPLDIEISISYGKPSNNDWASICYLDGSEEKTIKVGLGEGLRISGIEYWLNLEDIYPTSGGLVSHGKSILQRALSSLGITSKLAGTFEAHIEFSDSLLTPNEKAVLERLILGQFEVLANTLIGSPQIVDNLHSKGKIVFLPSFNHLGLDIEYLLKGASEVVQPLVKQNTIESTTFLTGTDTIAIVSAPSTWRKSLLDSAIREGVSVWPVISASSKRNIIRSENLFPAEKLLN